LRNHKEVSAVHEVKEVISVQSELILVDLGVSKLLGDVADLLLLLLLVGAEVELDDLLVLQK